MANDQFSIYSTFLENSEKGVVKEAFVKDAVVALVRKSALTMGLVTTGNLCSDPPLAIPRKRN